MTKPEDMMALAEPKCSRCKGAGWVYGIIDDDLFVSGRWLCERNCPAALKARAAIQGGDNG